MSIYETLAAIQTSLVAKKDKFNKFGGYSYRSAESILESLKPHLKQHGCTIKLDDEMQEVGGRVYVKATATLTNAEGEAVSASAYAREAVSRKGMDDSQLTGSTSSYARKYALGGLFAIDDSSDADSMDNSQQHTQQAAPAPRQLDDMAFNNAKAAVQSGQYTKAQLLDATKFALTDNQRAEVMSWTA